MGNVDCMACEVFYDAPVKKQYREEIVAGTLKFYVQLRDSEKVQVVFPDGLPTPKQRWIDFEDAEAKAKEAEEKAGAAVAVKTVLKPVDQPKGRETESPQM